MCKRYLDVKDKTCPCETCEKNRLEAAEAGRKNELANSIIDLFYMSHRQEALRIGKELDEKYPCLSEPTDANVHYYMTGNILGTYETFDNFIFEHMGEHYAISPYKYNTRICINESSRIMQRYKIKEQQAKEEVLTCA